MTEKSPQTRGMIYDWFPEDRTFWNNQGQSIARRNLWISIPCLLLAFCVWMLFSIVAVYLNPIGFSFSTNQLFLLTAIPGISGALLRIPYSFVIPIFGGRKWTAFSTFILIIPCIWLAFAIENPDTPYEIFVIISLLCGFGGANFASSMANISFFFPKAKQGVALGLNGGLGNLGVSVIQFVAPLIIFVPLWATQTAQITPTASFWLQNAGLIWVPFLVLFSILAFFGMNDLATSTTPFREQAVVLKNGNMWTLSLLYLATFGSFIGFSAAFAMLSKMEFPTINIALYAFSGPFIGALGRPLGGWLSDKWGGIRTTFINYLFMIVFMVALFATLPGQFSTSGSFHAFYFCFLFLFFTAGFGSGSTFQMISIIFREIMERKLHQAGMNAKDAAPKVATETAAALGFISAIGAIGAFFIPQMLSFSLITLGSVDFALGVFLIFYIICAVLTKGYYARMFRSY